MIDTLESNREKVGKLDISEIIKEKSRVNNYKYLLTNLLKSLKKSLVYLLYEELLDLLKQWAWLLL